jgi:omega-6 fatty acid desaturase (delta-12 desaturase)
MVNLHTGFLQVCCYYLLPYMVVNYHLVLITFLQHTDVYMPHFRGAGNTDIPL